MNHLRCLDALRIILLIYTFCLATVRGFVFSSLLFPSFLQAFRMMISPKKFSRPYHMTSSTNELPSANTVSNTKTSFKDAIARSVPGKSWLKCRPLSIGGYSGQNIIPNNHFETLVDTNDAWISKRTGIKRRRVIEEGSSLRDLATRSANLALSGCKVNPLDIDLVIVATSSPDDLFGDAPSVAAAIGATNAAAFDLTVACSGFLYATVTAGQYLNSGAAKKALVIGADALTRFVDWNDRNTCILFGDGSGAMILEATETKEESGLLGFAIKSDGRGYCHLKLPFQSKFTQLGNTEKTMIDQGSYGKMTMNGQEVYKFAVDSVRHLFWLLSRL
jgi:3-oxoacyl-[acyl-carrier-protein] synthase-3